MKSRVFTAPLTFDGEKIEEDSFPLQRQTRLVLLNGLKAVISPHHDYHFVTGWLPADHFDAMGNGSLFRPRSYQIVPLVLAL